MIENLHTAVASVSEVIRRSLTRCGHDYLLLRKRCAVESFLKSPLDVE